MSLDRAVKTVRLTVITDFVCVCCCIGQYELLDAIKHCKDTLDLPIRFELEHIPFRLISTTVLPEGAKEARHDFFTKSLGKEKMDALENNVIKWGQEKGRPLMLNGIMSQSTKAHRIVLKAGRLGGQDIQTPLISAIFAASMEEGKDVDDPEVLADIAAKNNVMSREEALSFIESDELAKEVEEMSTAARAKGVTGVPVVIIDGKWAVSGSQSCDVYVQIFKKLSTCQGAGCATTSPLPTGLVECTV
ncbi:thioredoxin-like protein [Ephemerocybe angulata]|uniref:Thioredoxin-like protein n=1 Tax=Ephemerocybe angulata TaxID=980116 RepID=A0A8H6HWN0_9AGAR|nr:thioredoxin-like protein [Tulosesus angulatus]